MQRIGEYDLQEEIGRGGMATVFRVIHSSKGSVHALKLFDAIGASREELLAKKFCAEAKLTQHLGHPNVVRTTNYGFTDDGRPYLVMDFVGEGHTLADSMIARALSHEEVLSLYHDLRSALAYCHSNGIVHADLKAENILLGENGQALLSDFGIARILRPELRESLSLTASTLSVNLGTPYALAPECVRGELATPASDVYAFGVLLFKLTTGIWYEGSPRLLSRLREFAPTWAPLLGRMLAKDPAKRPADATFLPANPLAKCRRRLWLIPSLLAAPLMLALAYFSVGRHDTSNDESTSTPAKDILGGYVPYAVLTPADTLSPTGMIHFGTVVLPDTNGYVHVKAPKGFSGTLIRADHAQGSLYSQFHVDREPNMRVLVRGNHEIIVKYQ